MNQILIQKINNALLSAKEEGLTYKALLLACNVHKKQQREFRLCLQHLISKGTVIDRQIRIYHSKYLKLSVGIVTRLMKTFGFVTLEQDGSDVFVPGKFFMGAMPGDKVLIAPIKSRKGEQEGEVVKIIEQGKSEFTGIVNMIGNEYYVIPDTFIKFEFHIKKTDLKDAKNGDKVLCKIIQRGQAHMDHKISIVRVYGDSQTAVNCAQAILDSNDIYIDFPPKVQTEASLIQAKGISAEDYSCRTDLRQELIFTIDAADTKDIDDAISLKKVGENYELGVHIADVSHYVKKNSKLEQEAYNRGTSIYFADRVVPMLPKELSNNICSLNEGVDRLAFSCIMQLSPEGKLLSYQFKKSVINSKLKGVYSEINQIYDGIETPELKEKYKDLYTTLFLMKELSNILTKNKRERGAPDIETAESYIVLDENSVAVDVIPRSRGESEVIIEEFMITANQAAASLAIENQLPFVHRVHEPPSLDKLESLRAALTALHLPTIKIKDNVAASELANLITQAKGEKIYTIINNLVLRSMSKAKYYENPIGHYGLVLKNYAQFTSPIRRYPDLTIHRVLSDYATGMPIKKIKAKYEKFVVESARRSTEAELKAIKLERECEDCYKAEYMKAHLNQEFNGIISSVTHFGMYVELPNTIEGLVRVENMPEGEYVYDEMFEYKNTATNKIYRIGDLVKIKCISVDVSAGNIDFAIIQ